MSGHSFPFLSYFKWEINFIFRVVSTGGDGTFADCCNGLLLRAAKEAGVNVDDTKMKFVKTATRIGIIPTGFYCFMLKQIISSLY